MSFPRPSASHEWYYCSGSHPMQAEIPNEESDATREGTACHWVAEQLLEGFVDKNKTIKTSKDFIDKLTPNNIVITEEMYQAALDYTTVVINNGPNSSMHDLHIEEGVTLDNIYPGMKGTPDAWVYIPQEIKLKLTDLKYGHGHVEVFENPQLMIYVSGILAELLPKLAETGVTDEHITVEMIIVQPRSFHRDGPVRTWSIKASDLRGYFNKLHYAAHEAMSDNARCIPGKHCNHCRAKYSCYNLQGTTYNIIDIIRGEGDTIVSNLSGNNLALELQLLRYAKKLLDYRLTAIETQVESEIIGGKSLNGFMVEQGYGRKRWKKDTPTQKVLTYLDALGVDVRKPDNLDTPTQALAKLKTYAKEMGVKIDESIISDYIEKPKTGLKVVEDDGSKARQAFRKQT